MTNTHPIFAEIEALLDRPVDAPLDELEHTLTAGYAVALQLEGERWRLDRRIKQVAVLLADVDQGDTKEIAGLAQRLDTADADLSRLRAMLGTLREHAAAARAA